MGNIYEIKYTQNKTGGNIQKMDKNKYVILSTGEIREFVHTESRIDCKTSVSQSLKKLRDIINTNVTNPSFCRWVTLTYRENQRDHKKLYHDFRKFVMRFNYYCYKNKLPKSEYIAVMEPQARGAWHAHLLLIFPIIAPFISNDVLAGIWGHGFVNIKSLKNVDNIGAYLSAYVGDMELSEAINSGIIKNPSIKEVSDLEGKNKKYFIKGQRLKLYPPGFRIFRKSKGIKTPVIRECLESEAIEEIGVARLVWEKTVKISSEENEVVNIINYRQFNKIRK